MNYKAGILAQRWREEMVGNSPDMEPAMEICYPSFEDIWGSELLGNETYSWFVGVIGTSKPTYLFTQLAAHLSQFEEGKTQGRLFPTYG